MSNYLPPGCTDADIERAWGDDGEQDEPFPPDDFYDEDGELGEEDE
jgi:hypothetical protein